MIKIARLYYESGMTQDAIAQKLRLSRPRVSRLMQEAIDLGIVKITIAQDSGSYTELEKALENKYGLLEVVVTDITDPDTSEQVSKDLGMAAADYFSRLIQDNDVVGFTWGATLAAMVENLKQEKKHNVTIVQMVGGLGEPASETHATGLVGRAAMVLGASFCLMPAPGVVNSAESAALLKSNRYLSQALTTVNKVNIAFVGIGAPTRDSLLMRDESIITWNEMDHLIQMGAVGDIGLHFYDIQGKQIQTELNQRVIGIKLEELQAINRVVGIAGGKEKFNAILGAIRGHWINTLITDSFTAQRLSEVDLTQ